MAIAPKVPGSDSAGDREPAVPRPSAPTPVTAAAVLLVVAAAVQIIASVMGIIHAVSPQRLDIISEQIDAMSGNVPSVESIRNMGVITVVIAGLGTVAAYLLFAFFLRRGRSWARAGATVLIALTLVQLLGISFPQGVTTVAQLGLGAVAVALCYLPPATRYFAAVKTAGK